MTQAALVQLIDGRYVESCAEEWRNETLARFVLEFSTKAERQAWLADHEKRHGKEDADRLRSTMVKVHQSRAEVKL